MLHILKVYGISKVLVNAIDDMWTNTKAIDGVTDPFNITGRDWQGDTLALYLIVQNYALPKANGGTEMEAVPQENECDHHGERLSPCPR